MGGSTVTYGTRICGSMLVQYVAYARVRALGTLVQIMSLQRGRGGQNK